MNSRRASIADQVGDLGRRREVFSAAAHNFPRRIALTGTSPWVADVFNGAAAFVAVVIAGQIRRRRVGTMEVGD